MIRNLFSNISTAPGNGDQAVLRDMIDPAFNIIEPKQCTTALIFNSPHSGRTYPKSFLKASRLNLSGLRRSEDTFVEQLFSGVVGLGAPLMHAHFPRAFLDVNREPYELDPALIAEDLPRYANTQSVRVVGGLGTIARVVTESEEIYRERITLGDALDRINNLYKPYHRSLEGLLERAINRFGMAVLVDCHSMPSNPAYESGNERPDFVLGDRFSTSCNPDFTHLVAEHLRGMGYAVAFNKPYAGGYITEHYGRPSRNRHALQIEINRALYMDERNYRRNAGFEALKADLHKLAALMIDMAPTLFDVPRAAAE